MRVNGPRRDRLGFHGAAEDPSDFRGGMDDELLLLTMEQAYHGPGKMQAALDVGEREVRLRVLGEVLTRLRHPGAGPADAKAILLRMIQEAGG